MHGKRNLRGLFRCRGEHDDKIEAESDGDVRNRIKSLEPTELELDAKILTQMLTYPDFRLAPSQEKNMRERYGDLVKNQNEIIQSTTLTEKIIEDLSGRQPVAFCKLIAKCLSVDPSKRPSAVEALAWENAFVGTDEDEDILAYEKASTPTMTR